MDRVLLYSKKKFLRRYGDEILAEYYGEDDGSLREWLDERYNVSLLDEKRIPGTNVIFATVIDEKGLYPGDAITFSHAVHLLDGEQIVIDYLESIRHFMEVRLQYGLINNELVSIEDIPPEKRGLRCGCVCPGCGQPLIARLGERKRKHFGHRPGSECNIEHAQQTALHILAKNIIEQEKRFAFPGYEISLADVPLANDFLVRHRLPQTLEYRKPYTAECTSVALEKRISDFVPDVVLNIRGRICLVEIAVTHFVDETKQQKIDAAGLPVVEVDLSAFIGQQITREIVRDALIAETANKKWLYNPLKEKAIDWATEEYKKLHKAELKREEAAHQEQLKRQREKAQKELLREKKREETALLLEDLFEPENYKCELQQLRSDDKFQAALQRLHLRKDIEGELPFFLDIPITGEMIFACDRRIWQAALFDKFIYYRKMGENEAVDLNIKKVQACLREHMDYVPVDWKLASRATVKINGRNQQFTLFYDVVKQYLDYLHYIGFISELYYGTASVERIKTLVPPDAEHAQHLRNAIEHVDQFAPDVDEQIDRILHLYAPRYRACYSRSIPRPTFEVEPEESIKQRAESEYSEGRLQASSYDFDGVVPFYDKYKRRWLKCKNCGAIKREDEMVCYGGRGSENKGLCKNCK